MPEKKHKHVTEDFMKVSWRKELLMAAAVLLALCALAAAQGKDTVAVYMAGDEPKGAPGSHKVLGGELEKAISRSPKFVAVNRTEDILKTLAKEHGYTRGGAVDDAQIKALGKQFGVRYLCVVEISEAGGGYYLNAKLIDVETAVTVKSGSDGSKLEDVGEMIAVAGRIAQELTDVDLGAGRQTAPPPPPVQETKPAPPPPEQPAERQRYSGPHYTVMGMIVPYKRFDESAEMLDAPYVQRAAPKRSASTKDWEEYNPKTRFGARIAGSLQMANAGEDVNPYIGGGFSGGAALSIPISPRIAFETEANYLYKSMSQERGSGIKVSLWESAVNVPFMLRLATAPPGKFAAYFEGGGQCGFPIVTALAVDGADSDPVGVKRPVVEFYAVTGYGISFKAGKTFYLGFRSVFGKWSYYDIGLSAMF